TDTVEHDALVDAGNLHVRVEKVQVSGVRDTVVGLHLDVCPVRLVRRQLLQDFDTAPAMVDVDIVLTVERVVRVQREASNLPQALDPVGRARPLVALPGRRVELDSSGAFEARRVHNDLANALERTVVLNNGGKELVKEPGLE